MVLDPYFPRAGIEGQETVLVSLYLQRRPGAEGTRQSLESELDGLPPVRVDRSRLPVMRWFVQWLDRSGLEPERIYAIHGAALTLGTRRARTLPIAASHAVARRRDTARIPLVAHARRLRPAARHVRSHR